jgi:ribosomal subunit interface protein
MVIPIEVTFRNMGHSAAIEEAIRERAAKLDRFYPRITSCRVVVEAAHRRANGRAIFQVRVDVTVPGRELASHSEPAPGRYHEDVYIAIREAFDQMGRELEDHARRRRGYVKQHEARERPHGKVARLFPNRGYGFIERDDGVQVYFHKNSVHEPGFERLAVGTAVWFVEEEGEEGLQANAVSIASAA